MNNEKQLEPWKSALFGGVVAGTITAVAALAGGYFINYRLIEKPKLDADAQVHLNQLVPILESKCDARSKDPWTWLEICTTKNTGTYAAHVEIENVALVTGSESLDRHIYRDGQGFRIVYEDDKRGYRANPTSSGDLAFYVVWDKKLYPQGIGANDLDAIVRFSYQTPPDIANSVLSDVSQLHDDVQGNVWSGSTVETYLPPWKPTPQPTPVSKQAAEAPASQAMGDDASAIN